MPPALGSVDMVAYKSELWNQTKRMLVTLDKMRTFKEVLAIYVVRSIESGDLVYHSYKQLNHSKLYAHLIFVMDNADGYIEHDFFPIFANMHFVDSLYYRNQFVCNTVNYNSFKVFDKDDAGERFQLRDYALDMLNGDIMAENRFFTDFKRMSYKEKAWCLEKPLDEFPINDDVIFMAAAGHVMCEENYLDVPDWMISKRYIATRRLGRDKKNVPKALKKHNVWLDRYSFERV
jgi:hypothetical protein